jgi:small subunit ribosomal protein S10
MELARIKLAGRDYKKLEEICGQIKEIAKKHGVSYSGPIPLPTKKLTVRTMKTPCGDGTGHGNATWDKWQMRVHRRVVDVGSSDRVLRQIVRIQLPEDIKIDIEFKNK